jgi:hypothetical protein
MSRAASVGPPSHSTLAIPRSRSASSASEDRASSVVRGTDVDDVRDGLERRERGARNPAGASTIVGA